MSLKAWLKTAPHSALRAADEPSDHNTTAQDTQAHHALKRHKQDQHTNHTSSSNLASLAPDEAATMCALVENDRQCARRTMRDLVGHPPPDAPTPPPEQPPTALTPPPAVPQPSVPPARERSPKPPQVPLYARAPGMAKCRFNLGCYRRNPQHFVEFDHDDGHPFFATDEAMESADSPQVIGPTVDLTAAGDADESSSVPPTPDSIPTPSSRGGGSTATAHQPASAVAAASAAAPEVYSRAAWRPLLRGALLTPLGNDAFALLEVCRDLDPRRPTAALESAGVALLGPLRWMAGELPTASHQTDRGPHDPPELQPLLSVSSGITYGYWRDEPDSPRPMVVSVKPLPRAQGPGVQIAIVADNLLAAVAAHLDAMPPSARLAEIQAALARAATHEILTLKAEGDKSEAARERKKRVVCPTSNKMGLVVPYDRVNDLGYRRLHLTGKELRKLLSRIVESAPVDRSLHQAELDDLINWANIANDESDFGAGLQLGHDLLNHDTLFASHALQQLRTAYLLLGRPAFATIAKEHARWRQAG